MPDVEGSTVDIQVRVAGVGLSLMGHATTSIALADQLEEWAEEIREGDHNDELYEAGLTVEGDGYAHDLPDVDISDIVLNR